ncbi:Proteoglycan 4 [Liparis tanakae]|uniref:Proteoglycan 4 n=1 Tax=Liparis tanakae TaxID=230148 RepID=A0A4Z2EWX1_9TELE|nr:Proteoglycan 4 [Liparis tanakae]
MCVAVHRLVSYRPRKSSGRLSSRRGAMLLLLGSVLSEERGPGHEHQGGQALAPLREEGRPRQVDVGQVQGGERLQGPQQLLGVHLVGQAPQVEQPQAGEALEAEVRLQSRPGGGAVLVLVLAVFVAGQRGAALPVEDVAAAEETKRHQGLPEAGQCLQAAGGQAVAVEELLLRTHLLLDGLQVPVPDHVFSQLDPGQPGAPRISLGRKTSERRLSGLRAPWQHMVLRRFLRQNTVATAIRLSGSSPALAAMSASLCGSGRDLGTIEHREGERDGAGGSSQPRTPAAQQPWTPAAPDPRSPAAPQPWSPGPPQPRTPAAPDPRSPAAPEPRSPGPPQPWSPTAPDPCSPAAPDPCSPAAQQVAWQHVPPPLSRGMKTWFWSQMFCDNSNMRVIHRVTITVSGHLSHYSLSYSSYFVFRIVT